MRKRLTDLGEVAGAAMVTVGCGMWSIPLGLVAGGIALIGTCWLVGE